jgi:peptidyl-prolyl cis-trans isomerase C
MRYALTTLAFASLIFTAASSFGQVPAETNQGGTVTAQRDPMSGPGPSSTQAAPNPVVLRVNGEPIYAFEISMVMQTIQAQLKQRGETVDQRELAQAATQTVVEQKLLVQEARRFGIKSDELEVARGAKLAEDQAGGRAMLESKLQATGSSYDQFVEVIRQIEIMQAFIDQQIEPNVVVTDEEIAAYYEANPTVFEADERVHAYHMIFIVGEDSDPAVLSATRSKAEAARKRALTGDEEFTVVATELSEGPSAPKGGDLGWITKGALVSPLSETMFALEPGQISEVIQSRFGFHVVTISDRRPAETIGLEEASDQIETLLRQQKAAEIVGQLLETLVKNANVENVLGGGTPAQGGGKN